MTMLAIQSPIRTFVVLRIGFEKSEASHEDIRPAGTTLVTNRGTVVGKESGKSRSVPRLASDTTKNKTSIG